MTGWVILVDQPRDFPNAETPHKVITTSDYLARPKLFAGAERAKLINLSRSYNYQSKGYYASLLAEAVAGAGVEDVTLFEYPGLGHLESRAAAGYPPMGDEYWLPLDWDEGLVGDLVAWVQQR